MAILVTRARGCEVTGSVVAQSLKSMHLWCHSAGIVTANNALALRLLVTLHE